MPQFLVNDADALRRLLQESLKPFAVEIGTQVATCLLEQAVVKLCGAIGERVWNRVNSRHGIQSGYLILGVRRSPFVDRESVILVSKK